MDYWNLRKTIKKKTKEAEIQKITIGWKERDKTNKEETYKLFEVDNKISREEMKILLITEAIKEKEEITIITNLQIITMNIHDKIEQ